MRSCGGISKARNSTKPRRPVGPSGEYSLSMENSERCVLPVKSTSKLRSKRSTIQGLSPGCMLGKHLVHLLEGNGQFVQIIVTRFIHARRLAGRPNKCAGKQIRQRRMVLPIGDQAFQQVWASQHRAVFGSSAAQRGVVAATGAGMAAIDHEFFCAKTRQPGFFVQRRHVVDQLLPAGGWVDIDLDHTRIRRDAEQLDARVARRRDSLLSVASASVWWRYAPPP